MEKAIYKEGYVAECDWCYDEIGSIEQPAFMLPDEAIMSYVCRKCYKDKTGSDPREEDAEYVCM